LTKEKISEISGRDLEKPFGEIENHKFSSR
jgi:hypothetical protein